jgi:predicted secreted protein
MAASAGRQITVLWGSESPQPELEGVREKGIELNGEPIDITSDDDNGWRSLLTIAAQNEVNLSISGVSKDGVLRADWFAGTRTQPATIRFADNSEITGIFYLASYNETGTYNEATVFEAELQSSGVIAYTPGA